MSDETNQPLDIETRAQAYRKALKKSLEELRTEVDARLSASRDDLSRLIGEFEASLPEPPRPEPPQIEPAAAVVAEAPRDPEGPTLEDVASSLREIEGADSQPELLARLVEQASLFASRTLLLLPAAGDTLRCWASLGFGGAGTMLENLDLTRPQNAAWAEFERGSRPLDSQHCRALSDAVSVDPPTRGALIPLELRGQVLAVLYADQLGDDRFSMTALQLLTYGAARGLDTLGSGGPSVPAALREADLKEMAAAFTAPEEIAVPTVPSVESPAPEEGPDGDGTATGASFAEVSVAQPPVEEPLPVSPSDSAEPRIPDPIVAPPPPPPPETSDFGAVEAADAPPFAAAEDEADDLDSQRAAGFTMEGSAAASRSEPNFHVVDAPAVTQSAPPAPSVFEDLEGEAPAAIDAAEDSLEATEELTTSKLPGFETSDAPPPLSVPEPSATPPVPEPPAAPTQPPPAVEDTWELASEEPEEVPPPSPPPIPQEPAEALATQVIQHDQVEAMVNAAKAPSAPPPTIGGQVAPPADLDGPGSAFADRTAPDDPAHDEARRLARLLVSEIKLYNEDAIEAGRKEGNVYARMREDIDRSRLMYEERVDVTVRATSDYFKDELIRTLAGGDAAIMGL